MSLGLVARGAQHCGDGRAHYRLSRYCPVNQAIGRDSSHQLSLLDAELSAYGSRL